MYCENCFVIYESDRCPICGSRHGRQAQPDDFCRLTEKDILWGGMLEDVLKQNGIPYYTKRLWGAGMSIKMGYLLEDVSFYVPHSRLAEAQALVEELFSGEPGEIPKEEEPEPEA